MYQAIGIIELKSIAKGIEATDAALKSAGIRLVQAHPSCPGKYEIILTGAIADVSAAVEHVKGRFDDRMIDSTVIGRIDEQVITELCEFVRQNTGNAQVRFQLQDSTGKNHVMLRSKNYSVDVTKQLIEFIEDHLEVMNYHIN